MATKQPKWKKEEIRDMLVKSDKALIRGLLRIHSFQTPEEQNAGVTVEDNGLGFNAFDAEFLTDMAIFHKHNGFIPDEKVPQVRKRMLKYAAQLAKIANAGMYLR